MNENFYYLIAGVLLILIAFHFFKDKRDTNGPSQPHLPPMNPPFGYPFNSVPNDPDPDNPTWQTVLTYTLSDGTVIVRERRHRVDGHFEHLNDKQEWVNGHLYGKYDGYS